ncbi:hypothetical protein ABG775_16050 [Peribacillus simplex]|uniref:hypothetical protein n=1 Tax=Peribacillus TaxID=2675229 RepID=UPI00177E705D|nr:hypothetical protein [Brevibacillus sp. JNUCC-41]QOS89787.1 hypothetical protein JNUCC41_24230 [Brevibacillus sp. JNUCC-41]
MIKKGDLLYPSKWIKNDGFTLYPIANFDPDDYEYIFYPDFHTIDMQEVLNTFTEIKLEDDFRSLLALDELPASVEKMIREVIELLDRITELRYALQDWSRLDFFSMSKPLPRVKRDYRFVYKYDSDDTSFYKLPVGLRNAKGVGGESIYHKAEKGTSLKKFGKKKNRFMQLIN